MKRLAFLPALLLIVGAGLVPIAGLFLKGTTDESEVSLDWIRLLTLTYGQAALSAILSALIGVPGALLWAENRFRGRRALEFLAVFCFSLPPLLVALSVISVFGRAAWLGSALQRLFGFSLYGWSGVLIAHAFLNFPLFFLFVGSALAERPREAEMTALSLGASRLRVFFSLTLRSLTPALSSAFVLSFLYCASSFVIVLLLGGGPSFTTLEVALYIATKVEFDLSLAARLGAIQALGALVVFSLLPRPFLGSAQEAKGVSIFHFRSAFRGAVAWVSYWGLIAVLFILPILNLFQSGFAGRGAWREALPSVVLSLGLCAAVAATSTFLSLGLAYTERHLQSRGLAKCITVLASLPVAFSSVLLTTAWLVAYPVRFSGAYALAAVVLVQSFMALPLVYRPLRDRYWSLRQETLRTARSLGATPHQSFWFVELPFLRRAMQLSLIFGAVFSLGEVGALLMLAPEGTPPLSLLIFRWMHQYRFDAAYTAGALLLILVGSLQIARSLLEPRHE